jgi:hypothetical protein
VPKKYPEDPKLASWVETQRNLYNREYKQAATKKADSGASSSEDVPPAAAAPAGKSPEEWAVEIEKAATGETATLDPAVEEAVQVEAAAMEVVNEVTADEAKPAAFVEPTQQESNANMLDQLGLPAAGALEGDEKLPAKRLTQERKNMLDHLGFVWSLRGKRTDDHWDDMYRQLVEYKEQNGVSTCWRVPCHVLIVSLTLTLFYFVFGQRNRTALCPLATKLM